MISNEKKSTCTQTNIFDEQYSDKTGTGNLPASKDINLSENELKNINRKKQFGSHNVNSLIQVPVKSGLVNELKKKFENAQTSKHSSGKFYFIKNEEIMK